MYGLSLHSDRVISPQRKLDPKGGPHREGPEPTRNPKDNKSLRSDQGLRPNTVSTRKGDPIAMTRITPQLNKVQRSLHSDRVLIQTRPQRGDLIAKALSHIVVENPQELCTTRTSWRANDSIKVIVPICQANSGCTTKGLYVNLPETHSLAADEARRDSPLWCVLCPVSKRQGCSSQYETYTQEGWRMED